MIIIQQKIQIFVNYLLAKTFSPPVMANINSDESEDAILECIKHEKPLSGIKHPCPFYSCTRCNSKNIVSLSDYTCVKCGHLPEGRKPTKDETDYEEWFDYFTERYPCENYCGNIISQYTVDKQKGKCDICFREGY